MTAWTRQINESQASQNLGVLGNNNRKWMVANFRKGPFTNSENDSIKV